MRYGFERTVRDLTVDQAVERITAALATEGFGILTRIDVKDTLKRKLDLEFRDYVILGACNPKLAHRALTADPQIGLLLPCNVVVQRTEDGIVVSIADPHAMFRIVEDPALEAIANEANERLRRALASFGGET